MKFSLKTLAAAVVMATAASGASAAIDAGFSVEGQGELFFNIWDSNGSYTRDLNISFSSFESQIAAGGLLNLVFTEDALLDSFFAGTSAAGARSGALKFNLTANDSLGSGANSRRTLQTFSEPKPLTTIGSTPARSSNGTTSAYVNAVNTPLGANNSVAVDLNSAAYTGLTFKDTAGGFLNFSNAGGIANNSYATGLSLMVIGAASLQNPPSTYTQLFDQGAEIHVFLDRENAFHITAVPEPETYAMLLAGLGMLGFMARRRLNNRV